MDEYNIWDDNPRCFYGILVIIISRSYFKIYSLLFQLFRNLSKLPLVPKY